jgi:hypothetical protein
MQFSKHSGADAYRKTDHHSHCAYSRRQGLGMSVVSNAVAGHYSDMSKRSLLPLKKRTPVSFHHSTGFASYFSAQSLACASPNTSLQTNSDGIRVLLILALHAIYFCSCTCCLNWHAHTLRWPPSEPCLTCLWPVIGKASLCAPIFHTDHLAYGCTYLLTRTGIPERKGASVPTGRGTMTGTAR